MDFFKSCRFLFEIMRFLLAHCCRVAEWVDEPCCSTRLAGSGKRPPNYKHHMVRAAMDCFVLGKAELVRTEECMVLTPQFVSSYMLQLKAHADGQKSVHTTKLMYASSKGTSEWHVCTTHPDKRLRGLSCLLPGEDLQLLLRCRAGK